MNIKPCSKCGAPAGKIRRQATPMGIYAYCADCGNSGTIAEFSATIVTIADARQKALEKWNEEN
jgi:hypothetical protein